MEEGDMEPADERFKEKASDGEEMLRYEQRITELLLTIASLHGKIEHLQQQKAREDEDFSDLGSEYTMSLPRRPQPFADLVMTLPPPVHVQEGNGDLFLDVHKAMTSLENTVLSYRNRIPSAEAELEGYARVAESLEQSLRKFQGDDKDLSPQQYSEAEASVAGLPPDEMSRYKREIALYEQRNAALRVALEGKEEALSTSKTTLCTYQEERDKLQRKVKELQDSLCKAENLAGGFTSPVQEGETWRFQDPLAAAQNFIRCIQGASSAQPICCLFPQQVPWPMETHTKDTEAQTQQQHGFIEKLKCLNQLLSATLQECKSDSEHLSMLLGRRESDTTALRLAVQYSERCLEAYEVLWSLTVAQQHPWKESAKKGGVSQTDPDNPGSTYHEMKMVMDEALRSWKRCNVNREEPKCSNFKQSSLEPRDLEEDRKEVLQDYIRRLKAEQASLKLPTQRTPPGADSAAARINAGIGAKVAEVQRALHGVLPTDTTHPKMDKLHLVQELQATREALADLNIRLHLMEKEKQGLELRTYTSKAQEAACLLIIEILQGDWEKSQEQKSRSSDSSSGSSDEDSNLRDYVPICISKGTHVRLAQDAGGRQPVTDPAAQMSELLDTLARNRELNNQIQSLLGELEEKLEDCKTQEIQPMELTRDFFKAHSALVLAYQNARRKQEAQVRQLETQITLMSHRQAGQLQSLMHTLQRLESRADGWTPHVSSASVDETDSPAKEDYRIKTCLATDAHLNVK
ncbi:harmonin-binding protein USHBP1 [Eublepharis macularius]|uniref:Harmonin-binding protein USHBP1 n=1 Tax=Eublepharis macularius TaxID=481883 RepID=A0AA97JFF6_EUBMA|nr:harmonin-binding protein USHBP1 [Eublepharis macularius]